MPKFKGLNDPIKSLKGTSVLNLDGIGILTFQSAIVACCELHRPDKPGTGEALKAFDLGIRFQKAEKEIELNKEDLDFLKKIVNSTNVFLSLVIGRLIHYLDEV